MKKLCFLFLLSLMALPLRAEVIKEVRILNQQGEPYNMSSVEAFTSFKVGEVAPSPDAIRRSISVDVQRMRKSGLFSYVSVYMKPDPDGIVIIYTVEAKKRLRRIEIVGADKMRNKKVLKKSELKIGEFADDTTFALAAEKIKEAYRDFWYPYTKVEWETQVDDKLGIVDVTFHITEGEKLAIKEIVFEGNDHIKDKTLLKILPQKKKHWYSFLTGSGKYKPDETDANVFALKSYYMNEGFLDVQVSDPILDETDPKKAKMIFRIKEGQQYRVGKISITGMKTFSEDLLRQGLVLKPGDVAAYRQAQAGTESLQAFYGNRGYARTRIHPVFDPHAEKGTVDIRYEIKEGSIGYIDQIKITGNERTQDKVIRREMVVYPGDKYNRKNQKTSENRLRNLNYFKTVSSSLEPTPKENVYNLNVHVEEKPTGQFSAGVGFSSIDSIVGYIELSQGNFDWKHWPPVGAGQKFKVRAQIGTERNDLDFSFVEPWFMNQKLSFGIDLFHHESRYFSDDYEQQNDGIRFSLGKPFTRFTRGRLAYTFERYKVYDVANDASQAIKDEEGDRTKSGMSFTWTRDTRDQYFIPTRGNRTLITPYFAGGPLFGETDLYGMRIHSGQYWPVYKNTVLSLRGQVEFVDNYGDSDTVPIFDRLFLGGAYTLRGYEYRDISPQDENGESIGGKTSLFASIEYTVPIWKMIRAATFYDWGVVNEDSFDFDTSNYSDDWGVGIRLDMPGFPLHLDYAWPITYDEKWQDGDGRFQFLIGHVF